MTFKKENMNYRLLLYIVFSFLGTIVLSQMLGQMAEAPI